MEHSNEENKLQQEHIASIFKEYTTPSRVLRSFTNLSNTVIQTALSGQSKFVFEILQNADDAFEDQHKSIEIKFILQDNYLVVHHNGKGFDFNDVERICDYASQIEEVKATDLSKTGYKGLGFKSLFNLSDSIYIYSNGYSFRFDKTHWSDSETKPWQVIPIWCRYEELPLNQKYPYDQPVNFILRVNNVSQLESQLRELVDQPDLLLYLHRINKLSVKLNEETHFLERRVENFGVFRKIDFYKNQHLESTWLSRTYKRSVLTEVRTFVRGASRFIYPEKIKKAKEVLFTFALRSDQTLKEISKIRGLCYSTLPTQLHLTLPYHINSLFILNLDRTQLHENEWNEFLIYQIGYLQFNLLKDLAVVNYLKNYVIELFVRKINHPYGNFSKAFLKGFMEAKLKIGWLPDHQGLNLLKLGEAWIDEIEFFKQNFQKIRNHKIYPYLINYDVKRQNDLVSSEAEAKHFTYDKLFRDFPDKYYTQLTRGGYINFINYLYERLKGHFANTKVMSKLKNVPFLISKNKTLLSPREALLEESENTISDFLMLNPIDNEYLPLNNTDLIKDWLVLLGARRLTTPIQILRESILKWIDSGNFELRITMKNHIGIINYLVKGVEQLTKKETEKLKERLLILTESNKFKLAKLCCLPDAVSIEELSNIISDDEKISSSYDINNLRGFFIHVGVHSTLNSIDVFRKSILMWIKNGEINDKLTTSNYKPIIEFVALHYPTLEHNLSESEKTELRNMPVLTCGQILQKARVCYFDSAIPNVKGLESVIAKNKLVSINSISNNVYAFLKKIGVSKKISSIDVMRRSVLKWIQEGEITNRITQDNHHGIFKYIGEQWVLNSTLGLKPKERNDLKRMPILTEGGVFRAAYSCYWSISKFDEQIPGLKSVISSDEFVSSCYHLNVIKSLLEDLGVRNLRFTDIYEKYSNHLTQRENVKWFFSQLGNYWKINRSNNNDQLLNFLQQKLRASSCLLAKNGKMYSSTELYSSQFHNIYDIDRNSILLLEYEKLPEDLERYLGFKTNLDFKCIKQLLKAVDKNTELGSEKTRIFFITLLQQLKQKEKNEIRKCQLSLLSKNNKLRLAKDLYYFTEKDATCSLDSCYLKRIHGMSHVETLELAELCGVNTLPFKQEIKREKETYDNTLKEFYLEILPFIVVQESKKLNEDVNAALRRLYGTICAIKLYQCRIIYVIYPFGDPIKIPYHFDDLTFYVSGKWVSKKSKIHGYLSQKLGLETDIRDIIDMEQPITQSDKQEWLSYKKDSQKFYFVEGELKKLLSGEEKRKLDITPVESVKIAQSHHSEYEEKHFKDKLLVNKEELTVDESSSNESSVYHVEDESYLQKQYVIKDEGSGVYGTLIDEPEVIGRYEATIDSTIGEDINELDTRWLVPSELEIDCKKRIQQPGIQSHHSEYEEKHFKDKLLVNKEEFTADESSDESSVYHVEDEPYLQKQYAIKDEGSGVYGTLIDEPEVIGRYEATIDSTIGEDINELDTRWLVRSELEIDRKKRIQQPETPGGYHSSTESLHTRSKFFQEASSEKSDIKWLSEKYVFTFLQDHYKIKYPNSQFNLSDGIFTLRWRSHEIEIVWLNASGEKGQSYDLMLKKEGEVKRLIEVKSTDVANNDSFNMSHRKFIRKISQLAAELPEHKEKYCIYRVFNTNNSSTSSVEGLNSSAALYKVVALNR